MMVDPQYVVNYAVDDSKCKKCFLPILRNSLRISVMEQSFNFDGKQSSSFHSDCFLDNTKPFSIEDFEGYIDLRWTDQMKIKKNAVMLGANSDGIMSDAVKAMSKFRIEFSSKFGCEIVCTVCKESIHESGLRVGVSHFENDFDDAYGPYMRKKYALSFRSGSYWLHLNCFARERTAIGFTPDLVPSKIAGYEKLGMQDKSMVSTILGRGNSSWEGSLLPSERSQEKENESPALIPSDTLLREQTDKLWALKDELGNVSEEVLKNLLESNEQLTHNEGSAKLLDRVVDCMIFGALERCDVCNGQFEFSHTANAYKCTGNFSKFTKCQNVVRSPKRKPFMIPQRQRHVPGLNNYIYVKRERILHPKIPSRNNSITSSHLLSTLAGVGKPLSNMKFVVADTSVANELSSFGPSIVSEVDGTVVAVVLPSTNHHSGDELFIKAEIAKVHVVDGFDFLQAIKKNPAAFKPYDRESFISGKPQPPETTICGLVEKLNRCPNVLPVITRVVMATSVGWKSGQPIEPMAWHSHKNQTQENNVKKVIKYGVAIEPESGLADKAHVYQRNKLVYNAVLNKADIVKGTNSYYKIQLLESDQEPKRYWIFRSWGRVGTDIGDNKVDPFNADEKRAVALFERIFRARTDNVFGEPFAMAPGKYYSSDVIYGDDTGVHAKLNDCAPSNLDKSVQDLIRTICDVDRMKESFVDFKLMIPVGMLSRSQLRIAYDVLSRAQSLLQNKSVTSSKEDLVMHLVDFSNTFYTLVPHDFGLQRPLLLDSLDAIKKKAQMVDSLIMIERGYRLLKFEGPASRLNPLDLQYAKLHAKIAPLSRGSSEFELIDDYVTKTHGITHSDYSLEVTEVFTVDRDGEQEQFKRDMHNRTLLWHGSRVTNFADILSNGLCIAPPEAPTTGYMFGKGVYFADMVSKSANYCHATPANPSGLMLLCDVALGNMWELKEAKFVEPPLRDNMHSVKGVGRTTPDYHQVKYLPGVDSSVKVPSATPISSQEAADSDLNYNEFVVYNTDQIRIKYLVKVNFNFK